MSIRHKNDINKSKHTVKYSVFCFLLIFLGSFSLSAQERQERLEPSLYNVSKKDTTHTKTTDNQKKKKQEETTKVYLEQSDMIQFDQKRLPDVQIIKGNVKFRHDNAVMYCDSAYFYSQQSSFDAFGNVRIIDGDTLFIYGDFLFYDGNIKLARMRRNVRLENSTAVLTTDSMNYNRVTNLAYYYTGGKLRDEQNTLTSIWGQYSPNTKQALFKNKVHLVNESFTMDADTLKYNTETKIANIVGDTHIIYNKETDIYSTLGWYNTQTEQSMLLNRSLIVSSDGNTVIGDTLYYDKQKGTVEGFSHVAMSDTIQKITIHGNYVFYNEKTEYGLATDSALLVDWSTTDSLFMHADSILTFKDSIYDVAQAYYNVRFYRSDLQGACDSLVYLSKDSVATMYGEPVIWSGENQLSGEIVQAYIKGETIDRIFIPRKALAVQPVEPDSSFYNQVVGKELTAFMREGSLNRVEISGNAETIYFPINDKDSTIVGINKTQSSFVNMYFINDDLDRIVLTTASSGVMYPLGDLSGDDLLLNNFFFIDEQRPKSKMDVFLKFDKNRHKSLVKHSRSAASASEGETTSQTKALIK